MTNGDRIDLYAGARKMGEVLNGPMAFACISTGITKMVWRGRVVWSAAKDGTPNTLGEFARLVAGRQNEFWAERRDAVDAAIALTGGAK